MSNTSTDQFLQFGLPVVVSVVGGWLAYIAWFHPEVHQKMLNFMGSFYRGWAPGAQAFWESSFNFWITRVAFLFVFLSALGFLIRQVIMLIVN